MSETKLCVECKRLPANYWGTNFCYDCYRNLLSEPKRKENGEKEVG